MSRRAADQRALLVRRLRERRDEIRQAALRRVGSIASPVDAVDPSYAAALPAVVAAAIDYGLAGIERGVERPPRVPALLLVQARLAAANEVSLDVVLRRYFAGYILLSDFLMQEATRCGIFRSPDTQRLMRTQATLLDCLLTAVIDEYRREEARQPGSAEHRTAEKVKKLLIGEPVDAAGLGYELNAHHVGLIVSGPSAEEAMRAIAEKLGNRLLIVRRGEETSWAWLGGWEKIEIDRIQLLLSGDWPADARAAIGEPGYGLGGWRLSHQQAKAAWSVTVRGGERVVRYTDVALLASMLQDALLSASLRDKYLAPLEDERDGGAVLRETLRAYFASDRKVSSAAACLGVDRHTVSNRLRAIEEKLDHPLTAIGVELEAALRLYEFDNLADDPTFQPPNWQPTTNLSLGVSPEPSNR
jgi:hypothetical protein